MTAVADPLIKLYRADWSRWSLAAEVVTRQNDQAGRRYRYQPSVDTDSRAGSADARESDEELENNERVRLVLSDGEFCWAVWSTAAERYPADPARAPIDRIVRPDWLLSQLRLTVTGTTELAGRSMLMVRCKPRPRPNRWATGVALFDWVDFVIDAELGVVLRRQTMYQGQPLSVLELHDLTIDPAAATDPASFRPDVGVEIDENDFGPDQSSVLWRGFDWHGADWTADDYEIGAGGVAVAVARGALYLAARSVSRPEPVGRERTDDEAEMPAPPSAARTPLIEPISDSTLRLIAQGGRPPVSVSAPVPGRLRPGRADQMAKDDRLRRRAASQGLPQPGDRESGPNLDDRFRPADRAGLAAGGLAAHRGRRGDLRGQDGYGCPGGAAAYAAPPGAGRFRSTEVAQNRRAHRLRPGNHPATGLLRRRPASRLDRAAGAGRLARGRSSRVRLGHRSRPSGDQHRR